MVFRYISWRRFFTLSLELFFVSNIILLDTIIFKHVINQSDLSPLTISKQSRFTIPVPTRITTVTITPIISQFIPTITPQVVQQTLLKLSVKEYFIPLGTGETTSPDWDDIAGAQSYIDSTNYDTIKQVTFEASVHVPTGNQTAWIRLFNKTDGHPVWFSDMTWQGGGTQFLVSNPIKLDSGNKLYIVQMKTQLQYASVLDQAKVHIIIQ